MFGPVGLSVSEASVRPELTRVLDARLMLSTVAAAMGLDREQSRRADYAAEVISHKPGDRYTIRYRLGLRDTAGDVQEFTVVGKFYMEPSMAAEVHLRLCALRERVVGGPERAVIPAPLSLLPDLGIILQECCDGADLGHFLGMANDDRPLSLAGQWLAALHRAAPMPELEVKSIEHELRKMDGWIREIARRLPDGGGPRLSRLRDTLRRLAEAFPESAPAMIHRDYYHQNLIWNGETLGVLDFDQLAIGDPAMDVGHFLAHLAGFAYRKTGRADAFAAGARSFVRSYLALNAAELGIRLPFFTAYTFVKLGYQAALRKPSGWRDLAERFLHLAGAEGERAVRRIRP